MTKYITMPPIQGGYCRGCALRYVEGCISTTVAMGLPRCVGLKHGESHRHVFVEDTPEGRAAYIAMKLERANEPTR